MITTRKKYLIQLVAQAVQAKTSLLLKNTHRRILLL